MTTDVKEFTKAMQKQEAKVVQKNLAEPAKIEAGKGLMFLIEGGTPGGMQRCSCGKIAPQVCDPV